MTSVVEAVTREMAVICRRDRALAESSLAAVALALASELDDGGNSATSKSMCAKALMDALERLEAKAPKAGEASPLDEIRARRDRNLGKADAQNRAGARRGGPSGR